MQEQTLMQIQAKSIWHAEKRHPVESGTNFETWDLAIIAREAVDSYGPGLKSHTLRFAGGDPCLIRGNRAMLTRVLRILLANAVNRSAPGREVTTAVWLSQGIVCLEVSDQGFGIPVADAERLFLPYQKLDLERDATEEMQRGLAFVQRSVAAHGGDINVQGTPEHGTAIEVCFPATMMGDLAD